tara:strand:+ start:122 stop:1135 length:1014 start_codon:yes stop_codon:yes gene_type:complete
MRPITDLIPVLNDFKKIIITTHANPDADALGSSLGLFHFLKARGHEVQIITPTDYPNFISWLPGNDQVLEFNSTNKDLVLEMIQSYALIFCLDFSDLKRVNGLADAVATSPALKVMIDHHLEPENFDDYRLWDVSAAATAELIYDFIISFDEKKAITADIANCLYAGIMTDTGSFRYGNTTSKVHRTVAELIDLGANVNKVSRSIYDTNTINRLRFIGFSLLEKLIVDPKNNIAYFSISEKDIQQFDLKKGDTEGLVNYALSIQGIIMATIIKEDHGEVKLSFRSTGDFAVNKFASDHFEGGGHKNASGGISYLSLEATIEKFKALAIGFKEKYGSS